MSDEPRTIWVCEDAGGVVVHDSPVAGSRYHHDDVVRELRKALERIAGMDSYIDATPRGGREVRYGELGGIARAALGKMETGHD